jgi:hypothetical protein
MRMTRVTDMLTDKLPMEMVVKVPKSFVKRSAAVYAPRTWLPDSTPLYSMTLPKAGLPAELRDLVDDDRRSHNREVRDTVMATSRIPPEVGPASLAPWLAEEIRLLAARNLPADAMFRERALDVSVRVYRYRDLNDWAVRGVALALLKVHIWK